MATFKRISFALSYLNIVNFFMFFKFVPVMNTCKIHREYALMSQRRVTKSELCSDTLLFSRMVLFALMCPVKCLCDEIKFRNMHDASHHSTFPDRPLFKFPLPVAINRFVAAFLLFILDLGFLNPKSRT